MLCECALLFVQVLWFPPTVQVPADAVQPKAVLGLIGEKELVIPLISCDSFT